MKILGFLILSGALLLAPVLVFIVSVNVCSRLEKYLRVSLEIRTNIVSLILALAGISLTSSSLLLLVLSIPVTQAWGNFAVATTGFSLGTSLLCSSVFR